MDVRPSGGASGECGSTPEGASGWDSDVVSESRFDSSLVWEPGHGQYAANFRRADHRDDLGCYLAYSREPDALPTLWSLEWRPSSNIPNRVIVDLTDEAEWAEVETAAVTHHAASRRAYAWECYMRDNDPPLPPGATS